ncbi:MAG TPA: MEDS domain-containing protein [Myxococcales bacterium]|nr:MEDS domain-containing protein [Myxococcales bacterium]
MAAALRNTGIDPVGEMPWGTHFCHFYDTREDLLQTLLPFFKAGLENNEFCAWAVSEPLSEAEVWEALDRTVPGLDRFVSNRSIEVLDAREVYLSGGEIDLHRIIGNWSARLEGALARGYDGIRVSGNTAWLEQKHWRDFMDYEAELNQGIRDHPMLVLCTYPLTNCGAAEFLDVTGTHQFAVAKRRGRWEVVETPQLAQAKAEIARLNRDLEQRVLERTMQLEAAMADQKQAWSTLQETQRALAHVTRLTTITQLTESLAHEVNQPLTAISANATASLRWLARSPPDVGEATQAMQRVVRDEKRAGDVIAHARALVKKSDGERCLVDLNQMIRELLGFVQPELAKYDVAAEEDLHPEVGPVLGDRIQLQQLLLNLIMNSIEAMAGMTARPRRVVISCERAQGEPAPAVLVAVRDNGVGAAEEDLAKLFDAFFTTKRDGLGMGLSIGRSIAQAHEGRLWARCNADHGLTFYLLLPEAKQPQA